MTTLLPFLNLKQWLSKFKVSPFSFSLILFSVISFLSVVAQAQSRNNEDMAEGCAMCGIFTGVMIIVPILIITLIIAIDIALMIWVARDAKARGMDSAILWMILVFFTSVIGLLIYLMARPQGNLIQCVHCNNKRLQASAKCPHCNNT